jgi:hypothetical protein
MPRSHYGCNLERIIVQLIREEMVLRLQRVAGFASAYPSLATVASALRRPSSLLREGPTSDRPAQMIHVEEL